MDKWIRLNADFGGYKKDELVQVSKGIADAYIAAGHAADAGEGPEQVIKDAAVAALRSEIGGIVGQEVATLMKGLVRPGVGRIDPVEAEADKTKSGDDFIKCVIRSTNVSDLDDMRACQERLTKVYGSSVTKSQDSQSGAAGGWLVPQTIETTIMKMAGEQSVMEGRATKVPLGTKTVEWPVLDQYRVPAAGQSASFGGVEVYRRGEGRQRTASEAKLDKIKMTAKDLTALCYIGRDTVQDTGGTITSLLTELIGGAIGWRRDWEHFQGTGGEMCLGWQKSKAVIMVPRKVVNKISWQDIRRMYKQFMASMLGSAFWTCHPFVIDDLLDLKDDAGNLLYLPGWTGNTEGTAGQAPSGKLLGIPIVATEKTGAPGEDFDLSLIGGKGYLVGTHSGLELGMSEHFRWDMDEITLRAKYRDDAAPAQLKPITLSDGKGTNKVSAFIGLSATVAS